MKSRGRCVPLFPAAKIACFLLPCPLSHCSSQMVMFSCPITRANGRVSLGSVIYPISEQLSSAVSKTRAECAHKHTDHSFWYLGKGEHFCELIVPYVPSGLLSGRELECRQSSKCSIGYSSRHTNDRLLFWWKDSVSPIAIDRLLSLLGQVQWKATLMIICYLLVNVRLISPNWPLLTPISRWLGTVCLVTNLEPLSCLNCRFTVNGTHSLLDGELTVSQYPYFSLLVTGSIYFLPLNFDITSNAA